jgi:hypothetical protein
LSDNPILNKAFPLPNTYQRKELDYTDALVSLFEPTINIRILPNKQEHNGNLGAPVLEQ